MGTNTDYAAAAAQADRPRLAAIGGDRFVVLWERGPVRMIGKRRSVVCKGLVPVDDGSVKVMPKQLGQQSPSRADDVVGLGRQARFVSGNGADEKLVLNGSQRTSRPPP